MRRDPRTHEYTGIACKHCASWVGLVGRAARGCGVIYEWDWEEGCWEEGFLR